MITSELIKLASVPAQRRLLLIAVAMAALTATVFYASVPVTQGRSLGDLQPSEILGVGILGVDAAAFVMIIVAAGHVGSEYSTGMILSTLIITPSRRRVLVGKFVTVGLASVVVGAIAVAVCVTAALIVGTAVGIDPRLILDPPGIRLALGSLAMPFLYAMIAAASAFVLRSTALGIVVPLVVMAVGGLAGWFGDSVGALLTPLMPIAAIHSLSGVAVADESIGLGGAALSVVAWLGVSIGGASWRLLRRDA